jgi:hypothetical protein
MKRQGNRRMTVAWLVTIVGILAGGTMAARAEIVMSEPTNLGPVINDAYNVQECDLSHDGLELYFAEWDRPGGFGSGDIWIAKREAVDSPWQEPVNLGPNVNSSRGEIEPSISSDGLELYFGCWDDYILRVCTRSSKDAPWSTPVKIGPPVGAVDTAIEVGSNDAWAPEISADGLSLYFSSTRGGGQGGTDIWVAKRAAKDDPWGEPVSLEPNVNSGSDDWSPSISTDGLTLVFSRGFRSVWAARRESADADWGPAVQLGFNPPSVQWNQFFGAALSPDGSTLYFRASLGWGGFGEGDFWQVSFIPTVDFDGDGKVDATDMTLLMANWGKNVTLYDIGPLPLGDGVVDEKDLSVLVREMMGADLVMDPHPGTLDVPRGATLNWTAVPWAETYDVYFGTSFEAVHNADRANPRGVLASLGQTATMYDPEGILDFSQTYYWRVDFVIPGSIPTICKGPILDFTTEALAYPVKNIIATASSSAGASGPYRTVDGSGLDTWNNHSTETLDMWQSMFVPPPHWIQYEFDKVYTLHELWVWNSNQTVEPLAGFGAKAVQIEYSTDGTAWTPLANVPEFAQAPGQSGYQPNTIVSFGGVRAKFVKLTIETGWGTMPSVGLSEVRFFHIPDRSTTKP